MSGLIATTFIVTRNRASSARDVFGIRLLSDGQVLGLFLDIVRDMGTKDAGEGGRDGDRGQGEDGVLGRRRCEFVAAVSDEEGTGHG